MMRFVLVFMCTALIFACHPDEAPPESDATTQGDTTEPTEDTTDPTEDTTEPAEDTTEPAEDTTEPTEDTTEPAEDTAETADPCAEVTCDDHASCADGACYCDDGYTENPEGDCVATDPCWFVTCGELSICVDGKCECIDAGFGMDADGDCQDIDECLTDSSICGDSLYWECTNTLGSFECHDINECDTDNGGCDPNADCINQEGALALCECNPGFEEGADGQCVPTAECLGVVCADNSYCAEGTCFCNAGFSAEIDGVCVDINECDTDNGGCGDVAAWTCTNTDGGFECADINECDTDNGGCGDAAAWTCTNNDGGFACVDINECDTDNGGCGDDATCNNTDGGFECGAAPTDSCATNNGGCGDEAAWTCADSDDGPVCSDINECNTDNGGCGDAAAWTCTNNDGGFECADINECATDNGGCGPASEWLCDNNDGGFECTEFGDDACATDNGGCGEAIYTNCTNSDGGPVCTDINECEDGANAGCAQTCVNGDNGFACGCEEGFALNEDGVTCDEEGVPNSIENFDVEITQDGESPGWGTVNIQLTYTGASSLNMANALITFTAPFSVSAVWGGAVAESTSAPTYGIASSAVADGYEITVTYTLPEADWVDAVLETGDAFVMKFSPAELSGPDSFTVISVEATVNPSAGDGGMPPMVSDPVDLHVPGWGNCLAMGTVSNGSGDINQALADSMVSVIYKYAGPGGNGDRGHIVEPNQTIATIAQARDVEEIIAAQEPAPRNIMPVMVVYTAEASGGGAAEFDIIYTGEAELGVTPEPNSENLKKHYINLIRIVKTLQGAKDDTHPYPGSIVLNPDLLGAWQQNEKTQFDPNYRNEDGTWKTIVIKQALQDAIDWVKENDGETALDPVAIPDTIAEDVTGFIQSQNYVIRQYGPDITFGWQINLWAPGSSNWTHTRYKSQRELWTKVSSTVTGFFDTLGVYSGEWAPDFVTFDKYERDGLGNQAKDLGYAYNSLDWENYLSFVKQITDHYNKPALLWQIPGGHMPTIGEEAGAYDIPSHAATGGPYFLGDKAITSIDAIKPEVLNLTLPGTVQTYGVGVDSVEIHLLEDPDFDWTKQRLRKAAYSNAFAILWGGGSTTSVVDIGSSGNDNGWLAERVKNYYEYGCMEITRGAKGAEGGDSGVGDTISGNPELDGPLINNTPAFDTEVLLSEVAEGVWEESSVYNWTDFLIATKRMHVDGVDDYTLWLGGTAAEEPNATTRAHYGLVNLAAFISQSMKETIKYNACDENNWQFSEHWEGDTNYPITSACGQLGQDYSGYGLDPETGSDLIESCPVMPRAEISAVTHATWYGAPGPLFGAPDSALIEAGLPVADVTGYWTHTGTCSSVPDAPGPGHVYERVDCTVYAGQKGGSFKYDETAYPQAGSVEGCVWWGRGVIQTTGRHNFGLLNHFLGRSHLDVTDPFIRENYPVPDDILYPGVDFCSNPEFICSTTEYPELKWIAGLFYWMASVQTYDKEGWNYLEQLKAFVDGGMTDDAFLNSVSGIVNRGCHNPPCASGPVDGGPERLKNFKQVLGVLELIDE